jgi:hypothetical protein
VATLNANMRGDRDKGADRPRRDKVVFRAGDRFDVRLDVGLVTWVDRHGNSLGTWTIQEIEDSEELTS